MHPLPTSIMKADVKTIRNASEAVREGFTRIHTAGRDVQDSVVELYSRGFTYNAIARILLKDNGYKTTRNEVKKYIESRIKDVGEYSADTEHYQKRSRDEFANVLSGLQYVQRELKKKFKTAIEEDDLEAIKTYSRLINQNIETAHRILSSNKRKKEGLFDDEKTGFGQLLDSLVSEKK